MSTTVLLRLLFMLYRCQSYVQHQTRYVDAITKLQHSELPAVETWPVPLPFETISVVLLKHGISIPRLGDLNTHTLAVDGPIF
jgi:hypothetical protein